MKNTFLRVSEPILRAPTTKFKLTSIRLIERTRQRSTIMSHLTPAPVRVGQSEDAQVLLRARVAKRETLPAPMQKFYEKIQRVLHLIE